MGRIITFTLSVILAIAAVSAHAETREEMKARLSVVSAQTIDCLRIDSLRADLTRCASERNRLRIAAGCSHRWFDLGPGRRYCYECQSIADYLGGTWMVTYTGGMWVGPEPLEYPDEYGLRGDR